MQIIRNRRTHPRIGHKYVLRKRHIRFDMLMRVKHTKLMTMDLKYDNESILFIILGEEFEPGEQKAQVDDVKFEPAAHLHIEII